MTSIIAIETIKTCAVSFHQFIHPQINNCPIIAIEAIKTCSQLSPISCILVQLCQAHRPFLNLCMIFLSRAKLIFPAWFQ
uniref:Uncharacterized protein n=1 Tax=Populus trichocarpa TaxID=3694 RepID=U5FM64_POPTR